MKGVLFREMNISDVPAGLRLCRASGWNQLEADWEFFLHSRPHACRVADVSGEVVGSVATLRYSDRFSWLSMVLVDPQHRGNGIGTELLQEGLSMLAQERCCRLDATPAGRQIYTKYSFTDEYLLSRMSALIDEDQFNSASVTTRFMAQADLIEIKDYDFRVFGADRSTLLASLFARAPEYARVLEEAGRIVGYVLGRPGFLYDQLGPVVAQNMEGAKRLATDCLRGHDKRRFVIDAPQVASDWLVWLRANGFAEERVFFRMHRGEHLYPGLPGKQFAIAGPEFG